MSREPEHLSDKDNIKDLPKKDKPLGDDDLGDVAGGMKPGGGGATGITYTGENDIDDT